MRRNKSRREEEKLAKAQEIELKRERDRRELKKIHEKLKKAKMEKMFRVPVVEVPSSKAASRN